jgi:hypothetical protein
MEQLPSLDSDRTLPRKPSLTSGTDSQQVSKTKKRPKNIVKAWVESFDKFEKLSKGGKINYVQEKIILQQLVS